MLDYGTRLYLDQKNQVGGFNLAKAVNGVPPPGTDYLQGTLTFTGC